MQAIKREHLKMNATRKAVTKKNAVPIPKKMVAKKVLVEKGAPTVKVPPEFTMKQVKEIVALINDAGVFTTFRYKTDEFEIEISVGSTATPPAPSAYIAPQATISMPTSAPVMASSEPTHNLSSSQRLITSPMIGTFFRKPSPTSKPFVEIGDLVKLDTSVCIVEVMKLLNTIPAECVGKISQILVEDGASVLAGQALMIVEVS
jgi:acetyl-CoA carboxylase biotin carboxyl carrier protein